MSFNQGLYRVLSALDVAHWNSVVLGAFPAFSHRLTCFAVDWLGRVFATDTDRLEEGRPGVMMFEPGTGEALEIPCGVGAFHEKELIDYAEEALAVSFYKRWIDHGGKPPNTGQCIGYKIPLFLSGADAIENLELSDLEVYWSICAQLIQKTKRLPPGTVIKHLTVGE